MKKHFPYFIPWTFVICVLVLTLIAGANGLAIRKLTFKNRAGEPVALELQGLSYNYEKQEYGSPPWGQYYYLKLEPPYFIDQSGEQIYLKQEAVKLYTIMKDRYMINVIYDSELPHETFPGSGVWESTICKSNTFALEEDPDGYIDGNAYWDMEHNAKLSVKPCGAIPANKGDKETNVLKWYRPWFMYKK